MANELATTNKPKQLTIKDYMAAPAVREKMKEMLESPDLIRQFTTSVISIAGSDELLAVAEPRSLFNACLTAASLNLPINKNLGFAHIIGYRNNKKGIVEAQFQLGARGFRELAQRSGQYTIINQADVREGELNGRNRLTGEIDFVWNDNDAEREKMPVIGYFSYFRLSNGFSSTLYMSKDEVNAHGKRYSQSFKRGYGPWVDNYDAMALKTVSKLNISKNGPLSVDLQRAVTVDQAVIHDDNKVEYIDGDELADVGASDDQKAAIIAANQEENDTIESDNAPVTDEDLDNLEAAGAQATLIDEPKATQHGDDPRRSPRKK
jgi:recombination protein RecT